MTEVQLNLTRKGRPQNFDQVIGQDVAIKMLKNSLYRGQLFPVYLFWGQHGTGKTSLARVFAAAINCQSLTQFRQEPKTHPVPCLECASCRAMLKGKHPDFIEIDAASNTGVDNVRQIIEAAALMPLLGHKKIYLIDEAHMLSKAAFNAFLKILEEPPASALFMLATTDPQKIIETVRSRCFQLALKAVDAQSLRDHLRAICTRETIYADTNALDLIVRETNGSVRDAINLLEQVRFAQGRVTQEALLRVLGYVDDVRLLQLLTLACTQESAHLMQFLRENMIEQFAPEYVWRRLLELVRMTIWATYGLALPLPAATAEQVVLFAQHCPREKLVMLLDLCCSNERLFLKTTNKHLVLEMLLLKLCRGNDPTNGPVMGSAPQQIAAQVIPDSDEEELDDQDSDEEEDDSGDDAQWEDFKAQVGGLNDPLLSSIFKHASPVVFDRAANKVEASFARQFAFFTDWLETTKNLWQPQLTKAYGQEVTFCPLFNKAEEVVVKDLPTPSVVVEPPMQRAAPVATPRPAAAYAQRNHAPYTNVRRQTAVMVSRKPLVDVSNVQEWPVANLLLRYFPGTIREG